MQSSILFSGCSPNSSNSDHSRSDTTSSRLEGSRIVMNRDVSHAADIMDDGANKDDKAMVPLHKGFAPGDDDVICGRGKKCYAHTGNERFRHIVQSFLERYSAASSRPEKSEILSAVVSQVRKNSPSGGFVKQDTETGDWFEVGDFLAREKTSQAFRDALHEQYRSSKKSKHEKRRQKTKEKSQNEEPYAVDATHFPHGNAHRDGSPEHPMPYPVPVSSSPLVSRHNLNVLREDSRHQAHPRAYSFSGQGEMPVRGAPSRALSLSSGRGARRHSHMDDNMSAPREPQYRRVDSAPSRYSRHEPTIDELHGSWPRTSMRHPEDFGHDSWPRSRLVSNHSPMFEPTTAHHTHRAQQARQFHPVAPEDVAAMQPYPNTDEIMMEVENIPSAGYAEEPPHHHHHHHHHHWSPDDEMDFETSHSRRGSMIPEAGFQAPPMMEEAVYSHNERYEPQSSRAHQRNDSTMSAVIAAQLSSALSDTLPEDDNNPFEPIPIESPPPE